MNIAFLFAGALPVEIADVMVKSVRENIENAYVIQLTDDKTHTLDCVDFVKRLPDSSDLIDFRMRHLADLSGDVICLDYDVIVQRDITKVFQQPFDIAFTRRGQDKTASKEVQELSPHNLGVIFQRNEGRRFWDAARSGYKNLQGKDGWMWGQALVSDCIAKLKGDLNILELPGEYYNYTPLTQDEDVRARAVVHYKGKRKHWMLKDGSERAIQAALEAGEYVDGLTRGACA